MAIVMKFGGTSVADAAALENVARIVASEQYVAPVVVVSAMSGVTDVCCERRHGGAGSRTQAISSLKNTFKRHEAAAQELLSFEALQQFLITAAHARTHIPQLLKRLHRPFVIAQSNSGRRRFASASFSPVPCSPQLLNERRLERPVG